MQTLTDNQIAAVNGGVIMAGPFGEITQAIQLIEDAWRAGGALYNALPRSAQDAIGGTIANIPGVVHDYWNDIKSIF